MTTPINTTLSDNIGVVNFSLMYGTQTSLRAVLTADPVVDITNWGFEVSFYIGRTEVKTSILTKTGGGITVDAANMTVTLIFSPTSFASVALGSYKWDLRYTDSLNVVEPVLKGVVTIGNV